MKRFNELRDRCRVWLSDIRSKYSSIDVKQKQYFNLSIVFVILVVLFSILIRVTDSQGPDVGPTNKEFFMKKTAANNNKIHVRSKKLDESSLYKHQISKRTKAMEEKVDKTEDGLSVLKKDLSQEIADTKSMLIKRMEEELSAAKHEIMAGVEAAEDLGEGEEEDEGFYKYNVKLTRKLEEKPLYTIHDSIPAGSTARGILLTGVAAPTGQNASANPQPVLIRLIDNGTLPNRLKGRVKDCHIVGNGYGDLNSARVMFRIETMTCIDKQTEEIISTPVAGFITGSDGINGLRGEVEEMMDGHLSLSAISGLFSGLSNSIVPDADSAVTAFGSFSKGLSTEDKFKSGLFSGGAKSMDRLSEYFINRAEQLQPVILVPNGIEVDVNFIGMSRIGGDEVIKAVRENTKDKQYRLGQVQYD